MPDPLTNDPYAAPAPLPIPPAGSGRPVGVTVFAILCFVFAGLGVLGLLSSVAMFFAGSEASQENPVIKLCRSSSFYMLFTVVTTILAAIFVVVQIVAGLGLLKMSSTGRQLILIYAFYSIVSAIVINAVNYFYLVPEMRSQMQAQMKGAPPGAQQFIEVGIMIGMVGGFLFAILFPLAIIWYFNRAEIKRRFAAS